MQTPWEKYQVHLATVIEAKIAANKIMASAWNGFKMDAKVYAEGRELRAKAVKSGKLAYAQYQQHIAPAYKAI